MLQVGEDVEGGSSTRRTWGQQYMGNRGRAGDTERGGRGHRMQIATLRILSRNNSKHKRESDWVKVRAPLESLKGEVDKGRELVVQDGGKG